MNYYYDPYGRYQGQPPETPRFPSDQPGYPQPEQKPQQYYPPSHPQQYGQQGYYQPPAAPRQDNDVKQPPESPSQKKSKAGKSARPNGLVSAYSLVEVLATAWIIVVLFCTFFLRTVGVKGSSMSPTLQSKDKLIVTSMFYQPHRGDIVIIMPTNKMHESLVKRIIGLPGDHVEISWETGGRVHINGELLQPENYIMQEIALDSGEEYIVDVPQGCVFVLGDNRNNSIDSRSPNVDMVDIRYLMGKAVLRVTPNACFFADPKYSLEAK